MDEIDNRVRCPECNRLASRIPNGRYFCDEDNCSNARDFDAPEPAIKVGFNPSANLIKHIEARVEHDPVNHPQHYTSHPSGVECIQITRHMTFNIGNAIKYLWRAGLKTLEIGPVSLPKEKYIEDLKKAVWYINDQIALLEGEHNHEPVSNENSISGTPNKRKCGSKCS